MNQTTTAIYENGLLRPIAPLDLPEHSEVEIIIRVNDNSLHSKVRKALKLNNNSSENKAVISNKRREQIAEIFSADTNLGDYINEDRESR